MRFLKRLFCKHDLSFVRNIYGDEIRNYDWKRSIWKCNKCGKRVLKDAIHELSISGSSL